MTVYPSKIQVTDIIRWLEKKDNSRSTVLFLGARAGGLFRSKTLYATLQYFSLRTFNNMSRVEQFNECYHALLRSDFSKSDIDTILIASLQGSQVSETDILLAELIKAGFFDTIISTNIDNLIPRALMQVGMRQNYDFQVAFPEHISYPLSQYSCLLLKIFGDLENGEYNLIKDDLALETNGKLKTLLAPLLQKDVLMLGYDSRWDQTIDAMFPSDGGELYYVNEGSVNPFFQQVLQNRKGKYISGDAGNYEYIIRMLHWHLVGDKSVYDRFIRDRSRQPMSPLVHPPSNEETLAPPPLLSKIQEPSPVLSSHMKGQREHIFIGYSQKDKKHFQQLKTHLARYEREKLLDIWDDSKLAAGAKWYEETVKALNITRIAILLVSADFLASSFIDENVLPPLLQSAEADGAIILPIILSPCVFEDTPLARFQTFNSIHKPLSAMKTNDKQAVWANLARYIIALSKRSEK
jgi:hypothetical protein